MPTVRTFSLLNTRKALGLGQSEMARRMGLSLRPYQELESGARTVRSRHVRLAESVALDIAIENEDLDLAPDHVRIKILKFALMLIEQNLKERPLKVAESIIGEAKG